MILGRRRKTKRAAPIDRTPPAVVRDALARGGSLRNAIARLGEDWDEVRRRIW